MATGAPLRRQQSYLTEYDKLLAEQLRQMSGGIGAQAIAQESALGFPVGTLTAKVLGGVLAGAADRRAINRDERRNEAMSKLLQGYDKLPEAPVGSEEFVGGTYMRDGGDIVTNLAPVEDRSYGKNLEASQELGTVLRGSDGAKPNWVQRKFRGALPEKRIFNENQLATEAGYDAMDYNLYKQQVEAARPKPTVGEVEVFYDNKGKEFEGQTVVFPDGTVKVKRPDESIQTANFYNWDDITRTPPKEKDVQLITDSTTNEIIAIDKNNIDGGYITIREGKVPQNVQQFGNEVVDTNQIGEDGKFKVLFNIPKDVKVNIQTFNMPNGITKTVARDELTGNILWQEEIEQETIRIGERNEILSMVGNKITQLRAPEPENKQTIEQPDGVYIWNAKEGTIGEKLFDKEPNITWKEVFDPELKKNMLYGIQDDGSVAYKFDAKKEDLKKSARDIKINSLVEDGVPKKYAQQLVDGHISVEIDGNLFYIVNKANRTRTLIKQGHELWEQKENLITETINEDEVLEKNADMNLTELNQEKKKPWLVPRAKLDQNWQITTGTGLQKMDRLANVTRRTLIAVNKLHGIIKQKPHLIGYLGQINKWGQGLSGIPFIGEGVKAGYGAFGVDLDDDEIQEVNRLIREIESGITETKHVRGDRSPAVTTEQRTQDQMDLTAIWQSGKSVLPLLKGEFLALNRKFIEFQSVNPNNDYVEDWRKNPKYSNIVGNKNTQGNVVIIKTYDPDNDTFFIE